ncbi:unnamed protein product [Darwinula stevensoni]|uniref:Protein tweety homolog n=1 Tax=Darwinula stevensoni TaxID=69355 RepID=A0A7R9A3C1_9CRUS|nr:unnamed protein product [Darwinula stevensoni]CAG0887549.1 unnamed protein product [Darwinula stevensoni]
MAYVPSEWIHLYHNRPHVDISFNAINDTFNPRDEVYLESLGLWGSVPALILIFSLVTLLIYLLAYCCKRTGSKARSYGCLKWTLVILSILCCGALALGLYGNDTAHTSVVDFVSSVKDVDNLASTARNQTQRIQENLKGEVEPKLSLLKGIFGGPAPNATVQTILKSRAESMSRNVTWSISHLENVRSRLANAQFSRFIHITEEVEKYRWPAIMAFLGLLVLFCLVLMLGLAKRSRCTLMLFSVLGLLATVFTGLLVCAYFVIAMASSDLCVDPDPYVLKEIELQGYAPQPVVSYYMKCQESMEDPFNNDVNDALSAINDVIRDHRFISDVVPNHYTQNQFPQLTTTLNQLGTTVNATWHHIGLLAQQLNCRPFVSAYKQALNAGCNGLIFGLTWMLLSAALACLFFYFLVIFDSHLWIYMKRNHYLGGGGEEADPFLPSGSGSLRRSHHSSMGYRYTHTPPQTPPFPGTLNGRIPEERGMVTYSATPPPAVSIATLPGPNHGQYATLSRHCKTLESSNFY